MSSNEQTVVDLLEDFGLPTNAAKAFLALLKKNPATGYEISNQAGIPRSAVYAVLNRLESLNIINSVGKAPKKYIPLSPGALLEHLKRLNNDRLESLQASFNTLNLDEEVFDFWHIHGYKALILKIKEAINNSREKLSLAIWRKEYNLLSSSLAEASERGVDVILFSFCDLPRRTGTVISYGLDENDLLKIWNPKAIVVADQTVSTMGQSMDTPGNKAIWTNNEAITEIARNHIILDITLAGHRLGFDPNPIVQRMMKRADIHLDRLIEKLSGTRSR